MTSMKPRTPMTLQSHDRGHARGRPELAPRERVMSKISTRILAIATAASLALALPAGAASRGGGGGGGGGGARGGGGGGGAHVSGGGGGGFRGGGGGAVHFSAPAFSRGPVGVQSFARPAFSGGGVRSFARPSLRAGVARSFARMTFRGNRSIAGLRLGPRGVTRLGGVSRVNRLGGTGFARGALGARALPGARLAGPALAGAALATHTHGARWQHRGDWWRNRPFFGWAGPLYWPYFYDDLSYNVFWDYGPYYDDPFWAYGYGDIYGAMFSPYGYGELAGWAPTPAPRVRSGVAHGNAAGQPSQPSQPRQWSAMCGDDTRNVASLPIDRINAAVSPDDQQRAALDALANASLQAAQTIKAACPADVAFTPTGRLDAMEQRVQAMVQAVALIRPPLDSFYGMLNDEQKARFNALGRDERPDNPRAPTPACGPNAVIPTWPQALIEKLVRPSEGQRALLDKLKDAGTKAAEMLKASCPSETPATPPARLAAVASRLDTLLAAVQQVHAALNDFYGALSDEQKAQFNGIPPMVQNGQPRG
jgi:hypothetical protein